MVATCHLHKEDICARLNRILILIEGVNGPRVFLGIVEVCLEPHIMLAVLADAHM